MSLEVDQRFFDKWLARYVAETGRELRDVLLEEGGLLAKDAMRATPPNLGVSGIFSQPWSQQKKVGQNAIRGDLAKTYMPLATIYHHVRAAGGDEQARLVRAIISRDPLEATRKMVELGVSYDAINALRRGLITWDGGAAHAANRNRRGRVQKNAPIALKGPGLVQYRKRLLARVGTLKAGWYRAAQGLPLKGVPSWIVKASAGARGSQKDRTRDRRDPSLTLTNLVSYAGDVNGQVRFASLAIRQREKVFAAKAERVIKRGWKARR